jgi:hypothetical protein
MPLSTKGICAQILGSLATFRTHPEHQTENDCKVVLNHLVRAFSEPLEKKGDRKYYRSKLIVDGYTGETIKDHVVPVKEIMAWLFQRPDVEINVESISELEQWLSSKLLIAEITTSEDAQLNSRGLQSRMPADWTGKPDCPYQANPWARYMQAEIYKNFGDLDHN